MINDYFNEHKFIVRRIMTSILFILWCMVSIMAGWRLLINQVALPEGFRDYYYSFTGIVGVAVGFYYKARNGIKEKKENGRPD